MAYGVILKYLEVDKITWGGGQRGADGGKEGWGTLFLIGVETTGTGSFIKISL
jgi:hypothetical protein